MAAQPQQGLFCFFFLKVSKAYITFHDSEFFTNIRCPGKTGQVPEVVALGSGGCY
jgi:hypothetical protein